MTSQRDGGHIIWSRLEASPAAAYASSTPSTTTPTPTRTVPGGATRSKHWLYRLLATMGAAFWLYLFLKLFVLDIDRMVVSAVAPAAVPLLDYRVVATIGSLVVMVLLLRRWPIYVLYVLFFPVAVAIRVSIYLVRHRSWALFLGLLQAASSLFADFRYNVVTKSLALVAAIFIITTGIEWLIWPSAAYVALLMIWSLWRRVRRLLGAPSFIEMQRRAIRQIIDSAWLDRLTTLSDDLAAGGAEPYTPNQRLQVSNTISMAIAVTKVLYLWAYQLDRYRRRYSPSLVFNLASYTWVFFATIVGLMLLNLSLMKVAPGQYSTGGELYPISVAVYSLSTLVLGEAGGIHPIGQLAYALQFVGGIGGIFILTTFFLTLALTFLRERDDAATQALIVELRTEAHQQEEHFANTYALTVDEGLARLEQLGEAAAGLVLYLARALPADADTAPARET